MPTIDNRNRDLLEDNDDYEELEDDEEVKNDDGEEDIEEDEEETPQKPVEEPKPETPQLTKTPEEIEALEEKLKASSRGGQIEAEKNKLFLSVAKEAFTITDIPEENLRNIAIAEGENWDEMTDREKRIFKSLTITKMQVSKIGEGIQATEKVEEWVKSVKDFVDDTEKMGNYPELAGREDEFTRFCLKDNARGVPIDILAGAFANNLPKVTPKKNGSVLLQNRSGSGPAKNKELTADDMQLIRKNSPREYARMLKAGKFDHLMGDDDD